MENQEDLAGNVAGFWLGLWHGLIAPFAFVTSLFKEDIGVYEAHNNGRWYNFGFIFGLMLPGSQKVKTLRAAIITEQQTVAQQQNDVGDVSEFYQELVDLSEEVSTFRQRLPSDSV